MPDFAHIYFTFVAFIFGISIGSFLNVLIYRLPLGLNPAKGRSFCPSCKTQLKSKDLVPLFSYLFLKGRCRYCSQPISVRYFIVELLTGVIYALTVYLYGANTLAISYILTFSILIVIAYIDYDRLYIPNYLLIVLLIISLGRLYYFYNSFLIDSLIIAFLFSSLLLIVNSISAFFSKGFFGFADIKLAFILGLSVNLSNFSLYLFLTFLIQIAILISSVLRKRAFDKRIPFAPPLVISYGFFIFLLASRLS